MCRWLWCCRWCSWHATQCTGTTRRERRPSCSISSASPSLRGTPAFQKASSSWEIAMHVVSILQHPKGGYEAKHKSESPHQCFHHSCLPVHSPASPPLQRKGCLSVEQRWGEVDWLSQNKHLHTKQALLIPQQERALPPHLPDPCFLMLTSASPQAQEDKAGADDCHGESCGESHLFLGLLVLDCLKPCSHIRSRHQDALQHTVTPAVLHPNANSSTNRG
jgi:hypothetical protein